MQFVVHYVLLQLLLAINISHRKTTSGKILDLFLSNLISTGRVDSFISFDVIQRMVCVSEAL